MNASDYKEKLHTIHARGITKTISYYNYLRAGFSYQVSYWTISQMQTKELGYGTLKYWERMGYIIPRLIVERGEHKMKLYRKSDINAVSDAILARDYDFVRKYWMNTHIEGLPTDER